MQRIDPTARPDAGLAPETAPDPAGRGIAARSSSSRDETKQPRQKEKECVDVNCRSHQNELV